jgi:hypothetical protein
VGGSRRESLLSLLPLRFRIQVLEVWASETCASLDPSDSLSETAGFLASKKLQMIKILSEVLLAGVATQLYECERAGHNY